jgi:hypothetical protein
MSRSGQVLLLLTGAAIGAALAELGDLPLGGPWGLWAVHPGADGPCVHAIRPGDCDCDCDEDRKRRRARLSGAM